uniref:uncharacterized protein LOC128929379 n=1 Tax=Callithrix jacchus TaxID=9483 RepID=UPI0023DD4A95|nr:uncharacterized protein LOC128929379 [Callithrix jacchus]
MGTEGWHCEGTWRSRLWGQSCFGSENPISVSWRGDWIGGMSSAEVRLRSMVWAEHVPCGGEALQSGVDRVLSACRGEALQSDVDRFLSPCGGHVPCGGEDLQCGVDSVVSPVEVTVCSLVWAGHVPCGGEDLQCGVDSVVSPVEVTVCSLELGGPNIRSLAPYTQRGSINRPSQEPPLPGLQNREEACCAAEEAPRLQCLVIAASALEDADVCGRGVDTVDGSPRRPARPLSQYPALRGAGGGPPRKQERAGGKQGSQPRASVRGPVPTATPVRRRPDPAPPRKGETDLGGAAQVPADASRSLPRTLARSRLSSAPLPAPLPSLPSPGLPARLSPPVPWPPCLPLTSPPLASLLASHLPSRLPSPPLAFLLPHLLSSSPLPSPPLASLLDSPTSSCSVCLRPSLDSHAGLTLQHRSQMTLPALE